MAHVDLEAGTKYQPSELVVDLSDRESIREKIGSLGLDIAPPGKDERHESTVLNLALLRLRDFETPETTQKLEEAVARQRNDFSNPTEAGVPPVGGPEANLDRLLYCLRRMFGSENDGEFPEVGKNRGVVVGQPHLSGTGEKYPTPARRPADTPSGRPNDSVPPFVGVLDTKIYDHEDLRGSYVASEETRLTAEELNKPRHYLGHATFVAGLIRHYAPETRMYVRSVLSDEWAVATAWNVALEMAEFKDSGVRILCMAMGTKTADGQPPLVLSRAVKVLAPDILVVAPAGNRRTSTDTQPVWPAALARVVAIGAVKANGDKAEFSPPMAFVNLNAWGVKVVSTFLPGEVEVIRLAPDESGTCDFTPAWADWSGTSFALAVFVGRLAATASKNGGDVRKALDILQGEAKAAVRDVGGGGLRYPKF